ncbi:hypothetical protein [Lentzea sp. NPDC060358]|uniref:hypothetical protein n=1 Tax=Lentzea sp. NPDC060358 TaxID=3347103 RepID=UPI00366758D6
MSPTEDGSPFAAACRAMTRAEFVGALNLLRLSRELSFQQVSTNAGGLDLPKSTVHAMCTIRFPKREAQLRAFLTACEVSAGTLGGWVEQWQRLRFDQPQDDGTDQRSA